MEVFMLIYKATSKTSGKSYIGQTVDLKQRIRSHKHLSRNPKTHFHYAIQKYGFDDFTWEILKIVDTKEELILCEISLIADHDTFDSGYNMTIGGEGNLEPTDELKKRWSEQRKGRIVSEETRKKISKSNKGKPKSDRHKKSLKRAWETRPPITKETRQKQSDSSKGKINTKTYICTDPDGVDHITTNGLTLFCEERNLTATNLMKVLRGDRPHHKGWTIRRKE